MLGYTLRLYVCAFLDRWQWRCRQETQRSKDDNKGPQQESNCRHCGMWGAQEILYKHTMSGTSTLSHHCKPTHQRCLRTLANAAVLHSSTDTQRLSALMFPGLTHSSFCTFTASSVWFVRHQWNRKGLKDAVSVQQLRQDNNGAKIYCSSAVY